MKRLVHTAAANSIGRFATGSSPARVVVLCYHSVHPVKPFASSPELFDAHLAWLEQNCRVISLGEVTPAAVSPDDRPTVAITFDDGYADNYEHAFALLDRHGLTATFFVTAGLLEGNPAVVERFQRLRQGGYELIRPLTWARVREMRNAGMEFGAHTYSHPNLARLDRSEAYRELSLSREILEQRLGERITAAAYPYGIPKRHVTSETLEVAAEAGYECAAAVLFRPLHPLDSKLQIPRFSIGSDSVKELSQKVYGWWDYLGWWQETAPAWFASLLSPQNSLLW